jgi:hypothetical protein
MFWDIKHDGNSFVAGAGRAVFDEQRPSAVSVRLWLFSSGV